MRIRNDARVQVATAGVPRGWLILGLAIASWVALAGVGLGLSQLFGFVLAAW